MTSNPPCSASSYGCAQLSGARRKTRAVFFGCYVPETMRFFVELPKNLKNSEQNHQALCPMRCSFGVRPSSPRLSLPQGVVLLVTTACVPLKKPCFIHRSNRTAVFGTLTSSDTLQQQHLRTERAAHPVMMSAAAATAAASGSTTSAEKLGGYARLLKGDWSMDAASALERLVPELGGDKHKGQVRGNPTSCCLVYKAPDELKSCLETY